MSDLTIVPVGEESVIKRLASAERRLHDLLRLNAGDLPGANADERLRLLQEFFFHLVGTNEVLAMVVNEKRALGIDAEDISPSKVAMRMPTGDPIHVWLRGLHPKTRFVPVPANPYSDDAYFFRAVLYRNQVAHRHRNPLLFTMPRRQTFLWLDPRDPNRGASVKRCQEELTSMLALVSDRALAILKVL